MAVIRDKMPAFQLFQPASTEEALGVLDQYGAEAWVLAGGLDTWDWLKGPRQEACRRRGPGRGLRAA